MSLESGKTLANLALCVLVQKENLHIVHRQKSRIQGDVGTDLSVLKPVRDLCINPLTNALVTDTLAGLIAELLMRQDMDHSNAKKWVQDTLDIVSFLLSESLSHETTANFQLENALIFLSHNICVWSACDTYLALFAHDMILQRRAVEKQDINTYVNNVSQLLVPVLAKTLLEGKLSPDVERALLTRLYSFLQANTQVKKATTDTENFAYHFVLPLLISIRGKKLVRKSWEQIGSYLEKLAIRAIRNVSN
jgi:hypothetical protein